jgi:hypothetical protein
MTSRMNPLKEKWNETPQNPKNIKSLDTPKWNGKLETFKWNEIEEEGLKWDPSQLYIASRALNEKLSQAHKL